ncbi:hypothetical protein [Maridesulfovibrio sp. FT414]|uniref:hypothetical protein n=1 Tax=Maridesulfovibrio sp. FT414 TaxID=2979469 RepID=UPI003D808F32
MPEYFHKQKKIKASWRAVQIWQILVGCAHNQQLITYGQIAKILGYNGAGTMNELIGRIMYYCQDNKLPPLSILAINIKDGTPGEGFELDTNIFETLDEARMKVFHTKWYKIIPPSAEEFEDIWKKHEK